MRPVLFQFGALPPYSFGVFLSLAFLVAGLVTQNDFAAADEPPARAFAADPVRGHAETQRLQPAAGRPDPPS
jgi:hypothetical protein